MSEALKAAYDMGKGMYEAGVMDEITMRKLDALCLPQELEFLPEDIKRIRKKNHVSQAVFAALLGIGKTTVQHWEQGKRKPSTPSCRLLDVIDRKGLSILS